MHSHPTSSLRPWTRSKRTAKNRRARLRVEPLETRLNPAPDLVITKDDLGITTTPGGTVGYSLTVQNVGDVDATGVAITESVPANTTFNALASSIGWDPAGTLFPVGTLTIGASTTITYAVTVNNPMAAGVDQIVNSASVVDDGLNGLDPTPANNSSSDTTPVDARPI